MATYKVAADYTTANILTFQGVPGLLAPVVANTLYEIDVLIRFKMTNGYGAYFTIIYPIGAKLVAFYHVVGVNYNLMGSFNASNLPVLYITNDALIYLKGFVIPSPSAGNILFQIKKIQSGAITIFKGSRMIITAL